MGWLMGMSAWQMGEGDVEGYRILMTYFPAIFCEIQNLDNEHTYTVTSKFKVSQILYLPHSLQARKSA